MAGKKYYNIKDSNTRNTLTLLSSFILIVMLSVITLLLFLTPFYRGLFFTHELLIAQAIIFSLLILWGAFRLIIKEGRLLGSPLDLCLILLIISYTASFSVAVNKRSALEEILKIAAYLVVYLVVAAICRYWPLLRIHQTNTNNEQNPHCLLTNFPGIYILLHLMAAAAFIVTIASLGVAAGHWQIVGAYHDAGYRIASPMGYANTAAAYLMAAYFLTLSLAPLAKKSWYSSLYIFPATIMLTATILTFSRGVWLLSPPLLILMIIFTAPGFKLRSFLYFIVTLIPALPAAFYADPLFRSLNPVQGWWPIITAALVAGVLGLLVETLKNGRNKARIVATSTLVIGLVLTGLVFSQPLDGLLQPEKLNSVKAQSLEFTHIEEAYSGKEQLKNVFGSFLPERFYNRIFSASAAGNFEARIEMYRDAICIIKDYPLLGTGGGGWAALYQGYQNRVYYSTEVHNHFLQVWIEAGIFGFLAFIGIWISLGVAFYFNCLKPKVSASIRQGWAAVCLPVAVLGAHSIIDWNFSLAAIGIYLFVLLGIIRSMDNHSWFGKLSCKDKKTRKGWSKNITVAMALFVGISLLIYNLVLLNGYLSTLRSQQNLARGDLTAAVVELGQAIKLDPLRADNYHNLGILFDDQARPSGSITELQQLVYLAQKAYDLEPYNPLYTFRYGELMVNYVDVREGLSLIDRVITLRPLEREPYVQAALFRLRLMEFYLENNSTMEAERLLAGITIIESAMQEKIGDTKALSFILGRANYLLGYYEKAASYFRQISEGELYYEEAQIYLEAINK